MLKYLKITNVPWEITEDKLRKNKQMNSCKNIEIAPNI